MAIQRETSRSGKAERRRKELLQVSLRLFSENGYDATSIRDIAREAGVTEGLLYHYFKGKKDLLKTIVQESVCDGVVFEQLDQIDLLPMEEAVCRIGTHLLENLKNKKEIFKLMLSEARLFEEDNDHFIPKLIYQNSMLRFGAFLKKRMERGEIREMDPVLLARQFSGSLVAFFLFQEILLGKTVTDVPAEHFLKCLIDVFLHGIRKCEQ
ncbi:MAG: TetR/AcrR family transcriptional regulator [Candidatus Manganitrophaceae bacterium]|nr:MAG: TetR/AcrR family transcriptional regulator [Candidatus Manganitrophaceae bacterium]